MRKLNHQAAETVLLQCGTGSGCLKSKQVMEERAVMHIRSWTGILSGVAAAAVFAVIVFFYGIKLRSGVFIISAE